ncbi:MAG: 1-deoxy-D-xylulose-5-phosphate reductoisomerase [Thermoguttaceae bacterium]
MIETPLLPKTRRIPTFPRRIAVLGCSGSIGRSALEVVAASEGRLQIAMMSVHRRADILVEQIHKMQVRQIADQLKTADEGTELACLSGPSLGSDRPNPTIQLPECVIMTDEWADRTPLKELPPGIEVLFGQDALCEYVQRPDIDIVLSAIVGSVGFRSTWNALESGKIVALANKESLVMGGPLVQDLIQKSGGGIIPIDSEHSAILQCLRSRRLNESVRPTELGDDVAQIILTASGGPFRTWSLEEIAKATVADALAHPTWKMGRKITIDSATLMNKALEIIEARWLFNVPAEKLNAVIHPQSVVHSMVEFVDGSVLAQLSPPDMQLPIQLALTYPDRLESPARKVDLLQHWSLDFMPVDRERFAAIDLGLEVAQMGGTAGAVLNAANEAAVDAFLENRISFCDITTICRSVLEHHHFEERPNLDRLFELDDWARKETEKWILG